MTTCSVWLFADTFIESLIAQPTKAACPVSRAQCPRCVASSVMLTSILWFAGRRERLFPLAGGRSAAEPDSTTEAGRYPHSRQRAGRFGALKFGPEGSAATRTTQ